MSSPETPPPPAPRPAPPAPARDAPPGKSLFPIVVAIAFAVAIAGSWISQSWFRHAETAAPAPAPGAGTPAAAEAPAPVPTPAVATVDEVKGLKGEIDALGKKIDAMPKPEPAPDVKAIEEKIDGLAKSVEATAALPKSVEELSGKLADSAKTIDSLKAEVESLKGELAAMKSRPAPAATTEPARPGVDAAAMTAAVDLFKANRFADALAAFKKLPADDARVLYYTALSNGFATNAWTGETDALARKGVDQEKAGSPPKAEVDAAFAGLTPAQGKAWLDSYRARAR